MVESANYSGTERSLVVEYANILSEHGLGKKAKAFRSQYSNDEVFSRRARALEGLFRHRRKIRTHLRESDLEKS